jgi:hypothetical protein
VIYCSFYFICSKEFFEQKRIYVNKIKLTAFQSAGILVIQLRIQEILTYKFRALK